MQMAALEDAQPQVTAQPHRPKRRRLAAKRWMARWLSRFRKMGRTPRTQQQEVFTLTGQITEVGEDYLILEDAQQGQVHVNFAEDTVYEGHRAERARSRAVRGGAL